MVRLTQFTLFGAQQLTMCLPASPVKYLTLTCLCCLPEPVPDDVSTASSERTPRRTARRQHSKHSAATTSTSSSTSATSALTQSSSASTTSDGGPPSKRAKKSTEESPIAGVSRLGKMSLNHVVYLWAS